MVGRAGGCDVRGQMPVPPRPTASSARHRPGRAGGGVQTPEGRLHELLSTGAGCTGASVDHLIAGTGAGPPVAWIQSHWSIGTRVPHVRTMTQERVRTPPASGPVSTPGHALRNTAINGKPAGDPALPQGRVKVGNVIRTGCSAAEGNVVALQGSGITASLQR